ncbi:MYND finger domain-containing protein [Cryptosporidium muris RN66]|uniref:MYND finger domain-containing protein n=1 Tax=Cryptosporidium muris (strain RN66) TaxID=441375 RepID=B6AA24_CRYMR|nr:MYND finger domain-containing protein [Cryptosporidium muris RN66]EEA05065.1 MYND finger domain-containing protein [Cryptosporidium muris RN66]|eukprot:XP_002139414.1 MYND finger domain-containing protein [Cryptosporidium muris RN66]
MGFWLIKQKKRQKEVYTKTTSECLSNNESDTSGVHPLDNVSKIYHIKNEGKRKKRTIDSEVASLRVISRTASRVKLAESLRQPFLDYSPEKHPHITEANIDQLMFLASDKLAVKNSEMKKLIFSERVMLQKMRGVCVYVKAKVPTIVSKYKLNETEDKDGDFGAKQLNLEKFAAQNLNCHLNVLENEARDIELDITNIHSILNLSGLEFINENDVSELIKIRRKLLHMKEELMSQIPNILPEFVVKGLLNLDPNKLIGMVSLLLSAIKEKYSDPSFWATIIHELWLFLILFQHSYLRTADLTTELSLPSLSDPTQNINGNIQKSQSFPDSFTAINYLLCGLVDTKIPGAIRLLVRLNAMYYFESRINAIILFCESSTMLWIDYMKVEALYSNMEALRICITVLSETQDVDIQQITMRIFFSKLTSVIFYHILTSPLFLIHDRHSSKLIIGYIEFLNECLLIGHSKDLLLKLSAEPFMIPSIADSVFGEGYKFFKYLDYNNCYNEKCLKSNLDNSLSTSVSSLTLNNKIEHNHIKETSDKGLNIWQAFAILCSPKYKEPILHSSLLMLIEIIYFAFVYEIPWNEKDLKTLIKSVSILHSHLKKTTMETEVESSLIPFLLEDARMIRKYLTQLYRGLDIDLIKLQEWITDRRIKESALESADECSIKVPCFHPDCVRFTVGSRVKIGEKLDENLKPDSYEIDFRYCKNCLVASYCSNACQKAHWELSHSTTCGLMSRPPASIIFNSTVNWPLRIHIHYTSPNLVESDSISYIQDKYFEYLHNKLALVVFFDICFLSIPYQLSDIPTSEGSYSCGLRQCTREECINNLEQGKNKPYNGREFEKKRRIIMYKVLHNDDKLQIPLVNDQKYT